MRYVIFVYLFAKFLNDKVFVYVSKIMMNEKI